MRTVEQVLIDHDVEVKRGYMLCPSHDDSRPSCKVNEDYVYCFTCQYNADAAGLEAALSGRTVEAVLASWSDGTYTPSTVTKIPRHKQRLRLYSQWVRRSHDKMKDVLHNLPAYYHEAAKDQLWDIFDEVMAYWKDSMPSDLEKEIAYAEREMMLWGEYWREAE